MCFISLQYFKVVTHYEYLLNCMLGHVTPGGFAVHPAALATIGVGAPAGASPRSGAAVRGADGPPIKINSEKEKLRC